MTDLLNRYCEQPTKFYFDRLPQDVKNALVNTAIRIKQREDFINKTIQYGSSKSIPYDKKKGIQSLLVAILYIDNIKDQLSSKLFAKYKILSKDSENTKITISWDSEMKIYKIVEKCSDKIPKELLLYLPDLIEYVKYYYRDKSNNAYIKSIYLYKPIDVQSNPENSLFTVLVKVQFISKKNVLNAKRYSKSCLIVLMMSVKATK